MKCFIYQIPWESYSLTWLQTNNCFQCCKPRSGCRVDSSIHSTFSYKHFHIAQYVKINQINLHYRQNVAIQGTIRSSYLCREAFVDSMYLWFWDINYIVSCSLVVDDFCHKMKCFICSCKNSIFILKDKTIFFYSYKAQLMLIGLTSTYNTSNVHYFMEKPIWMIYVIII